MKLVILIASLAALTGAANADNLLSNPSFETQGSSADTAAGWNRWGDWINRETRWTPTHSGACLIGYHHWQITDNRNSGIWQDVPGVKAGQSFRFSAFVSADPTNASETPAKQIELRLEATHNGEQVTINSTFVDMADLQKDPQWHELSVTGTTPEDNLRVLIVLTPANEAPHRGGAVKIDDASLDRTQ